MMAGKATFRVVLDMGVGGSARSTRCPRCTTRWDGCAETFATTKNPPRAISLVLGSVKLPVLAQTLDTVKRVIDDHAY